MKYNRECYQMRYRILLILMQIANSLSYKTSNVFTDTIGCHIELMDRARCIHYLFHVRVKINLLCGDM